MLIPLGSPDIQTKLQGMFFAAVSTGTMQDIDRIAQEVARHGGESAGIVIRFNQHNPLKEAAGKFFEARGVAKCLILG